MDVPFAGFDSTGGTASSEQRSGYMDVSASAHAHVTGAAGDSGRAHHRGHHRPPYEVDTEDVALTNEFMDEEDV